MGHDTNHLWRIRMSEYSFKMLVFRLLKLIGMTMTAGLAYPWLESWYIHKWANRLIIDGRRVRYSGSASGLLVSWIKTWILSVLTLSLYWWLKGARTASRYVPRHWFFW